jgi:hypothetical protein
MIGTNVLERRHLHPHLETPRRKNNDATLTMKRSTTADLRLWLSREWCSRVTFIEEEHVSGNATVG